MQQILCTPRAADDDVRAETVCDQAFALLAERGVGGIAAALALLAQDAGALDKSAQQAVFVQTLAIATEAFCTDQAQEAGRALVQCPPSVAIAIRTLLHAAVLIEGVYDPAAFSDALLLCDAALQAGAGDCAGALALLHREAQRRDARFAGAARWTRLAIDPFDGFQPKLLIWDLDDTLWRGTLAEGDAVTLIETRVTHVRALNDHGIVSAICSKNDFAAARAALERFGLWDAFVFPRIAFVPKGEAVRRLIDDMQLRAENVLFLDDNPHNLHEVAAACPGIRTLDATSPACDARLEQIRADHAHIRRDRVAEYRRLQTKVEARAATALSNEAFLAASGIHVLFTRLTENVEFVERIEELINRSNQLNYTGSRVAEGGLAEYIMRIDQHDTHGVFVWDNYGDYGLVGFVSIHPDTGLIDHFVLSCRVMHMGIEAAMVERLREFYPAPGMGRFVKPLPEQSTVGISRATTTDPAHLARIRAYEGKTRETTGLRIMCDCQSGALQHYSRFAAEIAFDACPRLFSLPMMRTGEIRAQVFPEYSVLAAGTDYLPLRWEERGVPFDPASYTACARDFCRHMEAAGRHVLVVLPPEDAPDRCHPPLARERRTFARATGRENNALWRRLAEEHAATISLLELTGRLAPDEMIDASHYTPPALRRISGWIDDWYAPLRPVA